MFKVCTFFLVLTCTHGVNMLTSNRHEQREKNVKVADYYKGSTTPGRSISLSDLTEVINDEEREKMGQIQS